MSSTTMQRLRAPCSGRRGHWRRGIRSRRTTTLDCPGAVGPSDVGACGGCRFVPTSWTRPSHPAPAPVTRSSFVSPWGTPLCREVVDSPTRSASVGGRHDQARGESRDWGVRADALLTVPARPTLGRDSDGSTTIRLGHEASDAPVVVHEAQRTRADHDLAAVQAGIDGSRDGSSSSSRSPHGPPGTGPEASFYPRGGTRRWWTGRSGSGPRASHG